MAIEVQVIYALPTGVWRRCLQVPLGSTAQDALNYSGFYDDFPQFAGNMPPVGIFGQACSPDHVLGQGDRVEIYRPLVFDPMESRRRRAEHKRATEAAKKAGVTVRKSRQAQSS